MKKRDEQAHRHSCRGVVDLLCDYVEEDLVPEERHELDRHMADCPPCLAFLKTYQKTTEICRSLRPEDIPAELMERLKEFLRTSAEVRQ
jgi:anti-sigma factor RsiW